MPFPWGWVLGAAALLLVAGAVVVRRVRARPAPPPPPPPEPVAAPDAAAILLAGLDALATATPGGRKELQTWYGTGATLLRDYVHAQHRIGAPEHTSEEVVAALQSATRVARTERVALTALLSRCDAVKFAAREPTTADRREFVADARAVAETAS